jgi:hypothetical protein
MHPSPDHMQFALIARSTIATSTIDTTERQRETRISMLDSNQIVPLVNVWDVLRSPAIHPWTGCDVGQSTLRPDTPWSVGKIGPDGYVSIPTYVQLAPTNSSFELDFFANLSASCDVVASAATVLAEYISDSERDARELRKRSYRKIISSSAVSKDGHLSFLVPGYRLVCIESTAKDEVVHLETITLAEERDGLNRFSKAIHTVLSGWRSCAKRLHRLSILAMRCWPIQFGLGCTKFGFANALLPL